MGLRRYLLFTLLAFFIIACASHDLQVSKEHQLHQPSDTTSLSRRIFLLGDAGYSPAGGPSAGIALFKELASEGTEDDIVIILGDNIYPKGMPSANHPERPQSEHRMQMQLDAVKDFKGRVIVIPGNHDWMHSGIKSLEEQEDYIEDFLDEKKVFLPSDACGLEEVELDDKTHLIVADTQWFLADWDLHPGINDDCEIKSREKFFIELEGMLKKNEGKTVLLALHHPIFSYGPHGGYFAPDKHLFPFQAKIPLPGIGSLITLFRKNGGVSIQDLQNERYKNFRDRMTTLIAEAPAKIVFISGHEHNLQYIEQNNFRQIISGSGSKKSAARLTGDAVFTYGDQGAAILNIYNDGSSHVAFYGAREGGESPLFTTRVFSPDSITDLPDYPDNHPPYRMSSVYSVEETEVTGLYSEIWGKHYRRLYGTPVRAKVALLDTLYGGLTPVRMGGGHQTKTLRLVDKNGKEFNMRAMRKSGVQFLQSVVLKDKALTTEDYTGTIPEKILLDFYTAAHPYAAFPIPVLSEAAGVFHTNPKLFYIPKQNALGEYNTAYGDELYMLEERPAKEHRDNPDFGLPDNIESTDDLFAKLRKDEKYQMDEGAYIRARLFDMLIGDWDRHGDQWRWAEFEENGKHIFRPIPRDRDQAFSDFDGALLGSVRTLISPARMMQKYTPELNNLEWFNAEPLPMDRVLIQNSTLEDFIREAKHLQSSITPEVIDEAFLRMPEAVQDETMEEIKSILKMRKELLTGIASDYYALLQENVILRATDKDDLVEVQRNSDGSTRVIISRIKEGKKADRILDKIFYAKDTREIWIYGLDDKDEFVVTGQPVKAISIRLIGGQENDRFNIEQGKKIRVYDHGSKKNTVVKNNGGRVSFTDIYEHNIFNFDRNKYSTTSLLPGIGYNPDAGFIAGINYTKTDFGFERNPFSTRHRLTGRYHFATKGIELRYQGETSSIFEHFNLAYGAEFNSPTFTRNFFGLGNDTENLDEELGIDYNRVNMSHFSFFTGLVRRSAYGSDFHLNLILDGYEIEENQDRFIAEFSNDPDFYEWKYFTTLQAGYSYASYDNELNPSRGVQFEINTGYTINIKDLNKGFFFLKPELNMFSRLTGDKKLVLRTGVRSDLNFGNDLEFYQNAFLGGNSGLRGFRVNRFTGRNSLVFNGDLRYNFNEFKTALLPLQFGIYTGYDYGRVWVANDDSNTWHNSYGGGIYMVTGRVVNLDLSLFNSTEGSRFAFRLGLSL